MAHRFDSWRSSVGRSANTLDSGRGKKRSPSSLETRSGKTNTVIHIDVETILRWCTEKYTVSQRPSSFTVLVEEMARHNSIRRRSFASMVSYNNMIKGNIIRICCYVSAACNQNGIIHTPSNGPRFIYII